jgi:tetratricopeptide (TPR) repeat protein
MKTTELRTVPQDVSRGILLLEMGQLDQARDTFAAHLDKHPDSALGLSFAGLLMFLLNGDSQEGLRLCQDALRRLPDEPLCYLNLAKICYAMGNRRLTVKHLHRGLRLRTGRTDLLLAFFGTIGFRRNPAISFLPREHFLNKYIGMLTWKLGAEKQHRQALLELQRKGRQKK